MTEFSPQFEEFFNTSKSPMKSAIDRHLKEGGVQLHLTNPIFSDDSIKSVPSNFIVATKFAPSGKEHNVGAVGFRTDGVVHGLVVHPGLSPAQRGVITMSMLKAAHTLAFKTKLFNHIELKPHRFTSDQGLGVAQKIVPGAREIQPGTRIEGSWDESRQLAFLRKFAKSDFVCPACFSKGTEGNTNAVCKNCKGSGLEPYNGKLTLNNYLGIE